jgi:hypothetical protein
MTDIAQTILDRLNAEASPQRASLAELVVDHTLDLPLQALADPDEVLDIILAALTSQNLEKAFERHLTPARARREARWRQSGEKAGDLMTEQTAARVEALLSRPQGPTAPWARGAVDPADVRELLAPALQQVLLSFVEKVAALTPKVPRAAAAEPRAPSRFGLRDRLKANLKERGEQVLGAGKSVLDGIGLDFRDRLEETAREFGESASGVLRKGVEKRLESDEGKAVLARIRVQLFRRLLETPLSELAGDLGKGDPAEVGAILGEVAAHNATRDEVRTALRNEVASLLTAEGQRPVREILEEAGLLALVRDPAARRLELLSRDLFTSDRFREWLTEVTTP